MKTLSVAALLLATNPLATAQTCRMVKDIAPVGAGWPHQMTAAFGKRMYFSAYSAGEGFELWMRDGSGCRLLKAIEPGTGRSDPRSFTSFWTGSEVLTVFRAHDQRNGWELWVTDGTRAGSRLVKDLAPGPTSSFPMDLAVCNGSVLFAADDGRAGRELFVTDGTAAGTKLVKDIVPGSGASNPGRLISVRGTVYFTAIDSRRRTGLWRSDGTPAPRLLRISHTSTAVITSRRTPARAATSSGRRT